MNEPLREIFRKNILSLTAKVAASPAGKWTISFYDKELKANFEEYCTINKTTPSSIIHNLIKFMLDNFSKDSPQKSILTWSPKYSVPFFDASEKQILDWIDTLPPQEMEKIRQKLHHLRGFIEWRQTHPGQDWPSWEQIWRSYR